MREEERRGGGDERVLKDLGEEGEEKRDGWGEVGCRAQQKC